MTDGSTGQGPHPGAPPVALVGEVVTYDPIRRQGFMRIVEGPVHATRVFYALWMLPVDFKRPVVVASRAIATSAPGTASSKALLDRLRDMLKGHRFAFEASARAGNLVIAAKTVRHLGGGGG